MSGLGSSLTPQTPASVTRKLQYLEIVTNECLAQDHANCHGTPDHGVYKLAVEGMNSFVEEMLGYQGLRCSCPCHDRSD